VPCIWQRETPAGVRAWRLCSQGAGTWAFWMGLDFGWVWILETGFIKILTSAPDYSFFFFFFKKRKDCNE